MTHDIVVGRPTHPSRPTRASDADRDQLVDLLCGQMAEGRLTIDELKDRMTAAFAAATWEDLRDLVKDLPVRPGFDQPMPSRPPDSLPAWWWLVPFGLAAAAWLAFMIALGSFLPPFPLLIVAVLRFGGTWRRATAGTL